MNQPTPVDRPGAVGLAQLIHIASAMELRPDCDSFLFVRHGQTACNARRIFQGPDEPLDATGQAQAAACARLLASTRLARIVCSDMRRARETAAAIAAPHHLQPNPQAGLRERNFGTRIGTSSAQIDWASAPPLGETLDGFVQRTCAGLRLALASPQPLLIVAHGGTLHVLAALLRLTMPLDLMANAQPLLVRRVAGRWTVQALAAGHGAG